MSATVDAIRYELRSGRSPSLRRRRALGALAAVGALDFTVISLYQIGVIRRLPDLPGFDSNGVNASRSAYPLGIPDATLGALSYAAVLVLVGARGSDRHPVWSWLLGGVVLANALSAAKYLWEMIAVQRRACPYCLLGAGLNFTMLAYAAPEVRAAVQQARG